jgi:glycosyltransferase involved in cell wall biosynthesis
LLISVVICAYNAARTLPRALKSACRQTLGRGYEILVINDGSEDATEAVIAPYLHAVPNLRYLANSRNRGLVDSCNRALAAARGRYFIRLDADDQLSSLALECLVAPLRADETDFSYGDRVEVDEEHGVVRVKRLGGRLDLFQLTAAGTLMRRDLMLRVGGYREFFWEEFDLYIRYLTASGRPPVHIPRVLYHYHLHPDNMTRDKEATRRGWLQLKKQWGFNVLSKYGRLPDFLGTGGL